MEAVLKREAMASPLANPDPRTVDEQTSLSVDRRRKPTGRSHAHVRSVVVPGAVAVAAAAPVVSLKRVRVRVRLCVCNLLAGRLGSGQLWAGGGRHGAGLRW